MADIIHLSDLHFGADHFYRPSDSNSLANVLLRDFQELNLKPDCIVVSGDLTCEGNAHELKEAGEFLRQLARGLNLPPSAFVIVPGNHEVVWADVEALKASEKEPCHQEDLFRAGTAKYREAAEGFFARKLDDHLTSSWEGDDVFILGLNSCFFEGSNHRGIGYVSPRQLDFAEADLAPRWKKCPTRIAVLHHHLVPVSYAGFRPDPEHVSLTLNAPDILHWLARHRFKVALHGHQHQPFCASEKRYLDKGGAFEIIVLGAGSAGAKDECLGHVMRRQYQHIRSNGPLIRVQARIGSSSIPTAFEDAQRLDLPLHSTPPIAQKAYGLGLRDFHWFNEVPWKEYFGRAKSVEVFAITARGLIQEQIEPLRDFLRRKGTSLSLLVYDPNDDKGLKLFEDHFNESPGQRKAKLTDAMHEIEKLRQERDLLGTIDVRLVRGPLKFKYTYYRFDETVLYVPYRIEGRRGNKLPVFVVDAGEFFDAYLKDDLRHLREVSKP